MSTQTLMEVKKEAATEPEQKWIDNFLSTIGSGCSVSLSSVQAWILSTESQSLDIETISRLLNKTPGLRKQIGGIIFIKE